MKPTTYQPPEIRDETDAIIQQGAYGKGTAFANNTNSGVLDYINNNLEWLKKQSDTNTTALGTYLPLAGGTVTGDIIIDESSDRAIKGKNSGVGILYNTGSWSLRDWTNGVSPIYYNKSSQALTFPTGYRVGGTVTDSTGAVSNGNTTVQVNATDMTVKNTASAPTINLSTGGASQSIRSDGAVIRTGALEADAYSNVKTIQRGTAYSVGDIALSRKIASYMYAECTKSGVTAASTGPTFTRASVAYDDKGNQVAVNQPRFTADGLTIEESAMNYIPAYQDNFKSLEVYNPNGATYAVSDAPDANGYYTITVSGAVLNYIRFYITGLAYATYYGYITAYIVSGKANVGTTSSVASVTSAPTRFSLSERTATDNYVGFYTITDGTVIKAKQPMITTLPYDVSYTAPGTTRSADLLTAPASIFGAGQNWKLEFSYIPKSSTFPSGYIASIGTPYAANSIIIYFNSALNNILIDIYGSNKGRTELETHVATPIWQANKICLVFSGGNMSLYLDGAKIINNQALTDSITTIGNLSFYGLASYALQYFRVSTGTWTDDKIAADTQLSTLPLEADTTLLMPLNGNLNYLPAPDTSQIEPTFPTTANAKITDGTVEWTLRDRRTPPNAVTNISYAGGVLTLTMGDGSTKTVSIS